MKYYGFAAIALALLLAAPSKADLVGLWQFENTGADASTYGNNATLQNGATYSAIVPPLVGGGASLSTDGNNQFAQVLANASLNSPNFTLSYWINQNGAAQNGGFERVTSRGGDAFETAVSNTGALSFYHPSVGWNTSSTAVPASGWTNITWRGEGSNVSLFANGNLVFTRTGVNLAGAPPTGLMNIGARHTGNEGFQGLTDNVSLFNTSLNGAAITFISQGLSPDAVADLSQQSIVSNTTTWMRSTATQDGGPSGAWTTGTITPPAASTFTLTPVTTGLAGIVGAAGIMGGGAQPIGTDGNVTFFRTTFELDQFDQIAAQLQVGADNDIAVFINGNEIARETNFDATPWSAPLPGLTINPDGTIGGIVKFDLVDPSFAGFVDGTNEIIVAVRNPNSETGANAGGFAFRLDIASTAAVPEPATWASWLVIGATMCGVGIILRRKRRA